jgi:hypothetical protein
MLGRLDLVSSPDGSRIVVRDLKVKGKAPAGARQKGGHIEVDADDTDQLQLYALAWRTRTGSDCELAVDYVWRSSAKGADGAEEAEAVVRPADRRSMLLLLEEIDGMHLQIQQGIFPRHRTTAGREAWWCNEQSCGYWSRCIGSVGRDR